MAVTRVEIGTMTAPEAVDLPGPPPKEYPRPRVLPQPEPMLVAAAVDEGPDVFSQVPSWVIIGGTFVAVAAVTYLVLQGRSQ